MRKSRAVLICLILGFFALFIVLPAGVALAEGNPQMFDYYIKALEYGLKGLQEYFNFIIELFKVVLSI